MTAFTLGVAVPGCGQRESDLRFVEAPIAPWESDRLPAIDLPVANAMNEKRHERSMHRSRILDWPLAPPYLIPEGRLAQRKLSMTPVLAEALPQEDPQAAKAAFSIRRTTCRANGIRQFYLEAGAGPPVILLHGFPETSFAWRFQIPALARHYRGDRKATTRGQWPTISSSS